MGNPAEELRADRRRRRAGLDDHGILASMGSVGDSAIPTTY